MKASRESSAVTLADGRQVGLSEFGEPAGFPCFYFHGWPGSRLQARLIDSQMDDHHGLRILSVDRPGLGNSSPQPGRTLLDWPEIMQELAARLGLSSFGVIGVSGGCPYALVTAYSMPESVKLAAIVAGAPPLADYPDWSDLLGTYRLLITVDRMMPSLNNFAMVLTSWVVKTLPGKYWLIPVGAFLGKADRHAVCDPNPCQIITDSVRNAFAQAPQEVADDARIFVQPWGFRVEDLRVPVTWWHGTRDRNLPLAMARQTVERIPEARLIVVDGAGHYSLPIEHGPAILQTISNTIHGEPTLRPFA